MSDTYIPPGSPTVELASPERKKWYLPFRGGTISVWPDTDPGTLAVIAQLSLADPRIDAFYRAAEVTLQDCEGRVVWPPPESEEEEPSAESSHEDVAPGFLELEDPRKEFEDVFDMFS